MKRALVIDDHEPSRKNLVGVLAENGFQIVGAATSGAAGLQLASASAPDVILMAVGLPDLDGIRAARKIMQANPLPIVLVTSHYDAATIERAKRAGVMGYLIKPLREGELLPAIELAISHFQEFVALQKENENLKKTLEARKVIERAKGILMKRQRLSETEAFSLIQRKSMDMRKPMVEIAQAVILSQEITEEKTD
jgi:AmiR/NasT family two-component response regulator